MIPIFIPMMQSKIAALQNCHFGLKLHRKTNLVTAVEAMPSTNEQACIRMVRNFGWESHQGGGFCKPRLKLNPFDLAKVGVKVAVMFGIRLCAPCCTIDV